MNEERNATSREVRELYDDLHTYILDLGAQEHERGREVLFSRSDDFTRHGRFASIAVRPKLAQLGGRAAPDHVRVYLYLSESSLQKEAGELLIKTMARGQRIQIRNREQLERFKPLLRRAYESTNG